MYKVDLLENETILNSKELKDYESTFKYLNNLVKELGENRKIIIYEKKLNEWVKFGEWKIK